MPRVYAVKPLDLWRLLNSITEVEAKDVHRSLKVAAGIFKALKVRWRPQVSEEEEQEEETETLPPHWVFPWLLQDVHVPRLITPAEKGRDLEARVMDAYIIQSQAEAQEGAVGSGSTWPLHPRFCSSPRFLPFQ